MNNPFETIDARLSNIENLLLDLKHSPKDKSNQSLPTQDNTSEILNIKEAATLLNLSIFTIYGLVHQRKLIHYKQGKKLMFKRSEILQFIDAGRKKTISEIESDANKYLSKKKVG